MRELSLFNVMSYLYHQISEGTVIPTSYYHHSVHDLYGYMNFMFGLPVRKNEMGTNIVEAFDWLSNNQRNQNVTKRKKKGKKWASDHNKSA